MRRPFQVKDRAMVSAFIALAALSILTIAGPAWAQMVNWADTARKGHDLATVACSNCHQVAVDQRAAPLLASPRPLIRFDRAAVGYQRGCFGAFHHHDTAQRGSPDEHAESVSAGIPSTRSRHLYFELAQIGALYFAASCRGGGMDQRSAAESSDALASTQVFSSQALSPTDSTCFQNGARVFR